jgi:hypothetical protein
VHLRHFVDQLVVHLQHALAAVVALALLLLQFPQRRVHVDHGLLHQVARGALHHLHHGAAAATEVGVNKLPTSALSPATLRPYIIHMIRTEALTEIPLRFSSFHLRFLSWNDLRPDVFGARALYSWP